MKTFPLQFANSFSPFQRFEAPVFFAVDDGKGGIVEKTAEEIAKEKEEADKKAAETKPFDIATLPTEQQEAIKKMIADSVTEATTKSSAQAIKDKEDADKKAERDRKLAEAKTKGDKDAETALRLEQLEEDNKKLRIANEAALKSNEEAQKIRIASRLGLPDGFHSRLLGSTPEEWEKDAKDLAKTLPTVKPKPGDTDPGNKDVKSSAKLQQDTANKIAGGILKSVGFN